MVGAAEAQLRLDPLDQHAAEDVGPGVVGGDADAGRAAAAASDAIAVRSSPSRVERRQQVDAGVALEGLGHRQPLRLGEGIDAAAAKREAACARRLAPPAASSVGAVVHQRLVGLARRDTIRACVNSGWCSGAALAVAEDAGEIEDPRLAGRQQLLAGEFRRGVQIERRAARRRAPISSVAKACRCASLPGETCRAAVSTSMKSRAANQSRSAAAMRVAGQQERPAVGVPMRASTRGRCGHARASAGSGAMRKALAIRRQDRYGARPICGAVAARHGASAAQHRGRSFRESHRQLAPQGQHRRAWTASSTSSSPPKTSIPARARRRPRSTCAASRDGVKVSRALQDDRAGRARLVEDRDFQFLYQDGDGFHFMNTGQLRPGRRASRTWSATRRPICRTA